MRSRFSIGSGRCAGATTPTLCPDRPGPGAGSEHRARSSRPAGLRLLALARRPGGTERGPGPGPQGDSGAGGAAHRRFQDRPRPVRSPEYRALVPPAGRARPQSGNTKGDAASPVTPRPSSAPMDRGTRRRASGRRAACSCARCCAATCGYGVRLGSGSIPTPRSALRGADRGPLPPARRGRAESPGDPSRSTMRGVARLPGGADRSRGARF